MLWLFKDIKHFQGRGKDQVNGSLAIQLPQFVVERSVIPIPFPHVSCWPACELYPTSYQANYLMKQLRGRLRSGSQPLISRTTIRPLPLLARGSFLIHPTSKKDLQTRDTHFMDPSVSVLHAILLYCLKLFQTSTRLNNGNFGTFQSSINLVRPGNE